MGTFAAPQRGRLPTGSPGSHRRAPLATSAMGGNPPTAAKGRRVAGSASAVARVSRATRCRVTVKSSSGCSKARLRRKRLRWKPLDSRSNRTVTTAPVSPSSQRCLSTCPNCATKPSLHSLRQWVWKKGLLQHTPGNGKRHLRRFGAFFVLPVKHNLLSSSTPEVRGEDVLPLIPDLHNLPDSLPERRGDLAVDTGAEVGRGHHQVLGGLQQPALDAPEQHIREHGKEVYQSLGVVAAVHKAGNHRSEEDLVGIQTSQQKLLGASDGELYGGPVGLVQGLKQHPQAARLGLGEGSLVDAHQGNQGLVVQPRETSHL
eukprot:RCo046971